MNIKTAPLDGTNLCVDSIVNIFVTNYNNDNFVCHSGHAKCSDYYCGITNDIKSNLSRHGIKGYVFCINCNSFEVSSQVEKKLGEKGFDIGNPNNKAGNGGADDSTVVYMAYKDSDFIQ